MKKLFLLLPIFLLALGFFSRKKEPIPIFITFSDLNLPLVKTTINNQDILLELMLNAKYPLFLRKIQIDKLNLKKVGNAHWKDSHLDTTQAPLYLLPKINVGSLTVKHTQTTLASNEELYGSFTWPLKQQNILLDFPNRRIYGITNSKELLPLGYDKNKMRKINCQINPIGITFKAHSSLGELNLALSTSGAKNFIESSKKSTILITSLTIDNHELENTQFFPSALPKELEIDGVLGVEFLKKHIVYLDAKQKFLYIGDAHPNIFAKQPTAKIPITFTQNGIPTIEIKVDHTPYVAKVDLGSSWELALSSEKFSPSSPPAFTKRQMNALGHEQPVEGYLCKSWQIGNGLIKNSIIMKAPLKSLSLQLSLKDQGPLSPHQLGLIGFPLLYRSNIFFDFPNSALHFAPSLELNTFSKVPFELMPWGLILKIQTDLGNLNFLLDTGATVSLVKNIPFEELFLDSYQNPCYTTQSFILGDYHCQPKLLYPFPLTSKLPIDGILGMDFLRSHALYIDLSNRTLYLKPSIPNQPI